MPRIFRSILAVFLSLCSPAALAAEPLQVEAMHYPAWLVRDYQTRPLLPGTGLRQDDLIRTGDGGRVQLRLADGSRVRLGEQSRFLVQALPAGAAQMVSLRILRGVFHITPGDSAQTFRIDLGDISSGFVDAEIWGRTDPQRDAVCLLRGKVEVGHGAANVQVMEQPLSCYVKPRQQDALAVDQVELQQHRLWLAETEITSQRGIAVAGGLWQLVLISLTDAGRAEQVLAGYRELGFPAQRISVVRNGRTLHRLLLPGFESIESALSAAPRIEAKTGSRDSWVWRKPD